MHPGLIVFIVFYIALLITYFITETSGKMYLRAPNKIVMASMFLVFGIYILCTNPNYGINSYHTIFIAALFLAWLGDVFLLFSLNRGGDFFLCGNICFVIYQIALLINNNVHINQFWWVILIYVIVMGGIILLFKKLPNVFKLGKMKGPMILYLSSITLNGIFGIAVMALLPGKMLLGLGLFLFMLSDLVLTLDKFVFDKNKWVLRLNSALYFTGMLLVVLSMVIII